MGMAASQARYLALVARKSNCEYEGQQINQARLALSNQSANLFNQMLGLTVPTPPSTQDFTRTQYSFSDGNHSYVVDSWRQLPASETQYNYDVSVHYFTDVYTGAMKTMPDPQVQLSNASSPISSLDEIKNRRAELAAAKSAMEERYNYWQMVKTAQESQIATIRANAITDMGTRTLSSQLINTNHLEQDDCNYYYFDDGSSAYRAYIYNRAYIPTDEGSYPRRILEELSNMVKLGVIDLDTISRAVRNRDPEHYQYIQLTDVSELTFVDEYTDTQKAILDTYAFVVNEDNRYYLALAQDVEDTYDTVDGGAIGSLSGRYMSYLNAENEYVSLGSDYLAQIGECEDLIRYAYEAYTASQDVYDAALAAYNALTQPIYIGNSQLTYLDTLTESQKIELQQVVKDMIAQGIDTDILNCFDTYGNYLGGVYSFDLYGVTYYTTYQNLLDAYASNTNSNNLIDDQYRMPYYNASYINTRIDQQGKALLETDGTGRFTTIRFENSSVSYSLNMETITDDEAYQDAMNQYYYENALYDKTVQDINAKTSIIQQEDSELELRLKQLDTEQNALKTEMDAVKKVIDDNIDNSFKTFGG